VGKKGNKISSQKKKLSLVMCTCHSSYSRELKIGELQSKPAWAKSKNLSEE
jgi:hypothetical protein